MEALLLLGQRAANLNFNQLLKAILENGDLQERILDLNRYNQLYEKGIDSEGKTLKEIGGSRLTSSGYSPATVRIKEEKGQKTDNITLNDTGAFYGSFTIILGDQEFYIEADPLKDDGTDLFKEWGEDILGLTDESKEILIPFILEEIIPEVIAYLLGDSLLLD